jgi:opacity protein-like surface antigen
MSFRKKYIYLLLFLILMSAIVLKVKAQPNMSFYPIENQFNSSAYNPAFLTSKAQFTFSIFPLAGTNIGFNNQKEIQNLISKLLSGVNNDDEYVDIVKRMVGRSTFNEKLESDLLSFTYRAPFGFINFRIRENVAFSASVKGQVSEFMILPETKSVVVGQVQNIPAQIMHYREYSLAYSTPQKNRRLAAGIRAKLYFGKSVFSSEISGAIKEKAGSYSLETWGKGYISMPEDSITNSYGSTNSLPSISSVGSYIMNSGNPGVGVDLGIKYKITPKISVSLSMLDLGKISWRTNLNSKNFNGEYPFKDTSIIPGFENGVKIISKTSDSVSFTNSFSNVFELTYDKSRFSTPLPVTFFAGVDYQLNPNLKINLVDRYIRHKDMNHNSFSATANFGLTKTLTVNAGYAIIGNAFSNFPFALLLDRDFGQVYIGTDNVLAFLAPSISEFSGLTFGACFYLFRKRKLYSLPTETSPFFRKKSVKKVPINGRILKETTDFEFPEQR